jgi:ABC-type transport system involved in multi-copper enzyme maturation permease subunit
MSTAVPTQPAGARRQRTVPPSTDRFDRVARAEWVKLWSVRSTAWSLLALAVVTVGIAALACWGTMQGLAQDPRAVPPFDTVNLTLSGLGLGQLAAAVLGAMVISTEYSTGGIRSTLTATPRRLEVLGAKAVVFVVVALVVGLLTSFASFFVGQALLREQFRVGLGDPGVLRALVGGGLYVAGSGMFGFAFGALLRHTAGAITAAVALLLVLPPLSQVLPGSWGDAVTHHFTSNAGQAITYAHPGGTRPVTLGPWEGYAWFTAEWLVVLVVAAVLMRRRDA